MCSKINLANIIILQYRFITCIWCIVRCYMVQWTASWESQSWNGKVYMWLFWKHRFPWWVKTGQNECTAGIYLFNVNNRNTRTIYKICSKLTVETPEQCHWCCSGVFIANFQYTSHIALVFSFFTLNRSMLAGLGFSRSKWIFFWPISSETRLKQFLNCLPTSLLILSKFKRIN